MQRYGRLGLGATEKAAVRKSSSVGNLSKPQAELPHMMASVRRTMINLS
jgi:hypothetical protein